MPNILTSGSAAAAVIEPKKLIALATKELGATSNLINYVTDITSYVSGQTATQVMIEHMAPSTGVSRACGTQGEDSSFTITADLVGKDNVYDKYKVDDCCGVLTQRDAKFVANKSAGLGRALDEKIIAILKAASATAVHNLDAAGFLAAKGELSCKFANPESLVLYIGCDVEQKILALADLNAASVFANQIAISGKITNFYGVPVIVSNFASMNGKAFLYSKDAIGVGFPKSFGITKQHAEGYGPDAYYVEMEQCLYIGALYLGKLGAGATESPWILELVVA